jgi:hypothetical protein
MSEKPKGMRKMDKTKKPKIDKKMKKLKEGDEKSAHDRPEGGQVG